jgi:phytoene dehydrogenase-like protein
MVKTANTARSSYDAVVVGSGPNGLSAAITLAQAGHSVIVYEADEQIGGGTRTSELTLPGFWHDVCSAIHPMGVASLFFRSLELQPYGLEWIFSPAAVAHPLDGGSAVMAYRSIGQTAQSLGRDSSAYTRLMSPLVADWQKILDDLLGPLPLPPRHLLAMGRFGLSAIQPAATLARRTFKGERARALFAGIAGHAIQSLDLISSAGVGLSLGMLVHATGWPLARGGSQAISQAMMHYLLALGGQVVTGCTIENLTQLPPARAILLDTSPRQLLKLAGDRLPGSYQRALQRYRYGLGVFKVDYALDGPVPWKAAECLQAATVHLGGTLDEIEHAERQVWNGKIAERPYVLVTQQSLFDDTRAPQGKHTLWAYCHVPNGSTVDMTQAIENQIERFAPGFRDLVLARHTYNTAQLEAYNPNYVGGDIIGGVQDIRQLFFRPIISTNPYRTPLKGLYLCSASTPPGGAVHGMCGYHAAQAVLNAEF